MLSSKAKRRIKMSELRLQKISLTPRNQILETKITVLASIRFLTPFPDLQPPFTHREEKTAKTTGKAKTTRSSRAFSRSRSARSDPSVTPSIPTSTSTSSLTTPSTSSSRARSRGASWDGSGGSSRTPGTTVTFTRIARGFFRTSSRLTVRLN